MPGGYIPNWDRDVICPKCEEYHAFLISYNRHNMCSSCAEKQREEEDKALEDKLIDDLLRQTPEG